MHWGSKGNAKGHSYSLNVILVEECARLVICIPYNCSVASGELSSNQGPRAAPLWSLQHFLSPAEHNSPSWAQLSSDRRWLKKDGDNHMHFFFPTTRNGFWKQKVEKQACRARAQTQKANTGMLCFQRWPAGAADGLSHHQPVRDTRGTDGGGEVADGLTRPAGKWPRGEGVAFPV